MRHRKSGVKLNRTSSHRDAMFRNMVTSLFKYERIRTTDAKAKELRRWADHLVTLAKRGDLHARRQAMAIIREKNVVHKLFEEASEKFGQRKGGYTRVIKIGHRPGDAAKVSMIELVLEETTAKKKKAAPKSKKTDAPAPTPAPEISAEEKPAPAVEAEAADAQSASSAPTEASATAEASATGEASTEADTETAEAAPAETEDTTEAEDVAAAAPSEEGGADDESASESTSPQAPQAEAEKKEE
jgi:large subunit ribosomal protein L17